MYRAYRPGWPLGNGQENPVGAFLAARKVGLGQFWRDLDTIYPRPLVSARWNAPLRASPAVRGGPCLRWSLVQVEERLAPVVDGGAPLAGAEFLRRAKGASPAPVEEQLTPPLLVQA
jgi:hypothetical protein